SVLAADESLTWHYDVGPASATGGCSETTGWMSQVSSDRVLLGVYERPHAANCSVAPNPSAPVAYVLASAVTGRVLGRGSLPAGAGEPLWSGDELVYPVQPGPTSRVRIEATDVTTRATRTVTSLPAAAVFALAGAASPVAGPAVG